MEKVRGKLTFKSSRTAYSTRGTTFNQFIPTSTWEYYLIPTIPRMCLHTWKPPCEHLAQHRQPHFSFLITLSPRILSSAEHHHLPTLRKSTLNEVKPITAISQLTCDVTQKSRLKSNNGLRGQGLAGPPHTASLDKGFPRQKFSPLLALTHKNLSENWGKFQ